MSNVVSLIEAFKALAPTEPEMYEGQAPAKAVAPWCVLNVELPKPVQMLTGTVVAGTFTFVITVSALTMTQCHLLAARVYDAYLGQTPEAEGWSVGQIEFNEAVGPYPAGLTATDTDLKYQVARIKFSSTCSEIG